MNALYTVCLTNKSPRGHWVLFYRLDIRKCRADVQNFYNLFLWNTYLGERSELGTVFHEHFPRHLLLNLKDEIYSFSKLRSGSGNLDCVHVVTAPLFSLTLPNLLAIWQEHQFTCSSFDQKSCLDGYDLKHWSRMWFHWAASSVNRACSVWSPPCDLDPWSAWHEELNFCGSEPQPV